MSRYGSGRKYAYAVAERLHIEPDVFVDAMKEAGVFLTAFDRFDDDNNPIDVVTKSLGGKCLKGLRLLQERLGETPEMSESIARLEARGFKAD